MRTNAIAASANFGSPVPSLSVSVPGQVGVASYPPGASFGPRHLVDFEFVWIIEGDVSYQRGDCWVNAPPDTIILCRPGQPDYFRWDPKRRTHHAFFHFTLHSFPAAWGAPELWPLVRRMRAGDIIRPMFQHIVALLPENNEHHIQLSIAHLLSAFVCGRWEAGEVAQGVWPEAVERVWGHFLQQLENDPGRPMTLAELGAVACVTPEHLCRVFKTATGHSPLKMWRLARLDHAVPLLLRSNFSVSEVARLSGFASPFHFTRCFKESYAMPPAALRTAVREGRMTAPPRLLCVRQPHLMSRDTSISDK